MRQKLQHKFTAYDEKNSRLAEVGGVVLEEGPGVGGHEPLLIREADGLARLVRVLHTGLTVCRVRSRDGVDTLADDGLTHDQLGLAVLGRLRRLHRLRGQMRKSV